MAQSAYATASGQAAAMPDATELVAQADQHMRGDTQYAEMTMTVVRPDWSREISMKAWSKGSDYALVLITGPARDKGTAFLKRGTQMWNWLPSVERVIKISPSMMLQPWMGSDFTNDDLVRESSIVNDYTHAIAGEDTAGGRDCWKIELTPKPDAAVVWGKVIMWIEKSEPIQVRLEYYDESGALVNTEALKDVKMCGGRKIPTMMTMKPVDKPGHSTILSFENCEFNTPIDDSFFSEQNMKRLR
ncbi:MAG: outer membrane lipoprotein-sorting protein [Candidatus Eisenbacteria bacterium]|nr:outer membrane lipoprotein-sorting protein [Candidatus Eisenbacteria bacterium]